MLFRLTHFFLKNIKARLLLTYGALDLTGKPGITCLASVAVNGKRVADFAGDIAGEATKWKAPLNSK